MDVTSIRHQNFRALVDERMYDAHTQRIRTKRVIAISFDMAPSFLSQLYAGKKMGDEVARKLEGLLQLPHGWMDIPHGGAQASIGEEPANYNASHSLRISPAILASAIALARLGCENLDVTFDPETEEDAELVILAANYLQARQEIKITVDNVVDFTKRLRQKQRERDGENGAGNTGSTGKCAG